jgi:hypothetical protein
MRWLRKLTTGTAKSTFTDWCEGRWWKKRQRRPVPDEKGVSAENEHAAKEDENERKGVEKGIHKEVKSLGSVFETKRYVEELKQAKWVIIAVFTLSIKYSDFYIL